MCGATCDVHGALCDAWVVERGPHWPPQATRRAHVMVTGGCPWPRTPSQTNSGRRVRLRGKKKWITSTGNASRTDLSRKRWRLRFLFSTGHVSVGMCPLVGNIAFLVAPSYLSVSVSSGLRRHRRLIWSDNFAIRCDCSSFATAQSPVSADNHRCDRELRTF